jgi:hypothetical protein
VLSDPIALADIGEADLGYTGGSVVRGADALRNYPAEHDHGHEARDSPLGGPHSGDRLEVNSEPEGFRQLEDRGEAGVAVGGERLV